MNVYTATISTSGEQVNISISHHIAFDIITLACKILHKIQVNETNVMLFRRERESTIWWLKCFQTLLKVELLVVRFVATVSLSHILNIMLMVDVIENNEKSAIMSAMSIINKICVLIFRSAYFHMFQWFDIFRHSPIRTSHFFISSTCQNHDYMNST